MAGRAERGGWQAFPQAFPQAFLPGGGSSPAGGRPGRYLVSASTTANAAIAAKSSESIRSSMPP